MKDIAIYGGGGFGREVACLIRMINEAQSDNAEKWNLIGFFDDVQSVGMRNEYGEVLGNIKTLNRYDKELAIAIAIGSPHAVKSVYEKIENPKIHFPNLISPEVLIADENNYFLGKGNIIQKQCAISCNVHLGNFNVLNSGVGIGHDVSVGSFNSFMPVVRISGEVKIGERNFFGVGSIVVQRLKIGYDVKLSAGSVLLTKPKDGYLYMGNPAKKTEF